MHQRVPIPLEGEFNCWTRGFDMPDLLRAVCGTRKTGLLRFVAAEAEKTLFIQGGGIVFASSTSEDDRLGEYLMSTGKISLRDLSRQSVLVRPGKRFGALLVESGLLDPKELVQVVTGQVRAIILSLFRWTEAWYGFNEQKLPSKEAITLNMPTAQLILDGVRKIDSWRRIVQGIGDSRSVYLRVAGNEDQIQTVGLDRPIRETLELVSRPTRVEDVCTKSPLPDIDVCRCLWVFRCLSWIEQVEDERADSLKEVEHREAREPSDGQTEVMVATPVPDPPPASDASPEEIRPVEHGATASLADLEDSPYSPGAAEDGRAMPTETGLAWVPPADLDESPFLPSGAVVSDGSPAVEQEVPDLPSDSQEPISVPKDVGDNEQKPARAWVPPADLDESPFLPSDAEESDGSLDVEGEVLVLPSDSEETAFLPNGEEDSGLTLAGAEAAPVELEELPVLPRGADAPRESEETVLLPRQKQEPSHPQPASEKVAPVLDIDTDDMDFEGLGLVLGDDTDTS